MFFHIQSMVSLQLHAAIICVASARFSIFIHRRVSRATGTKLLFMGIKSPYIFAARQPSRRSRAQLVPGPWAHISGAGAVEHVATGWKRTANSEKFDGNYTHWSLYQNKKNKNWAKNSQFKTFLNKTKQILTKNTQKTYMILFFFAVEKGRVVWCRGHKCCMRVQNRVVRWTWARAKYENPVMVLR